MSVNYGILQIGGLANKDGIQPRRLEHPCAEALGVGWGEGGPCLPSGDSQGGSQLGTLCGLPELKVKAGGERTAGGGGQHSQGCCSGFSGRREGASLEPFSSLLLFLEWEVFLSRPWRS